LDAVLIQPRTHELNLRFDTLDGTLTRSAQMLRLRRDTHSRLTYKGPQEIKQGVSARTEIEFSVVSFDQAKNLLEALGYQVSMIYEKYRAVYQLEEVMVTLDEMPFGAFAEIEGPDGAQIQAVCQQIGLLWQARTLQSYAALFEGVKQKLSLDFRDLTFKNFAEIRIAPSHLSLVPADLV
jgi:adenylate cyclase class 2